MSQTEPSEPVELIGGVEKRVIKVVPPDPAWSAKFAVERETIATALGVKAVRVDHIGSTSVPGLAAKPIIDIALSVGDVDREEDYLTDLITAGYQLRVREPGHRMVRTPDLGVHVHVCTAGSDWERRQLLFRDGLRYDESDRATYNSLKTQLAQRDWPDMNAYAAAKSPLITEITARAEKWAARSGWTV
ncbi:GrpB family protein [Mycolicibacterium brisbanense]|nr:GrpB family protein [Mycolicibacterium brisbanense]